MEDCELSRNKAWIRGQWTCVLTGCVPAVWATFTFLLISLGLFFIWPSDSFQLYHSLILILIGYKTSESLKGRIWFHSSLCFQHLTQCLTWRKTKKIYVKWIWTKGSECLNISEKNIMETLPTCQVGTTLRGALFSLLPFSFEERGSVRCCITGVGGSSSIPSPLFTPLTWSEINRNQHHSRVLINHQQWYVKL